MKQKVPEKLPIPNVHFGSNAQTQLQQKLSLIGEMTVGIRAGWA
jgi:hypothetical protein